MDAVDLIIAAVIAGVSAGMTETAKVAIKDTYQAFKAHLHEVTSVNNDASKALESVEKKPDSTPRQAVLKEELTTLGIEHDNELIGLAQKVLETLDKEGAQQGKYTVHIQNSQGIAIGDGAKVSFDSQKSDRKI